MATSSSVPHLYHHHHHHQQHHQSVQSSVGAYPMPAYRPSMMGLLTTVAELPHSYKMRYIKAESPLDLSVKPTATADIVEDVLPPLPPMPPMVPHRLVAVGATVSAGVIASDANDMPPMTPPCTPSPTTITIDAPVSRSRKRTATSVAVATVGKRRHAADTVDNIAVAAAKRKPPSTTPKPPTDTITVLPSDATDLENVPPPRERTPTKAPRPSSASAPRTAKAPAPPKERKHKTGTVRKLKFDEYKSSPVSGTIIRTLDEIRASADDGSGAAMESGDIDPEYNIVEVTDEVRAEIATIPNVIGGYACKLCRCEFEDVFGLARHRCSCIVLLDYKCPECGKRFNCPANLASHRRWHKPRGGADGQSGTSKKVVKKEADAATVTAMVTDAAEPQFPCAECGKTFKRQAYLRKHLLTHRGKTAPSAAVVVKAEASNGVESSYDGLSRSNSAMSGHHSPGLSNSRDSTALIIAEAADEDQQQQHHFRMFEGAFTEEENLAAAALAHLRNGAPSVIRHTTVMAV